MEGTVIRNDSLHKSWKDISNPIYDDIEFIPTNKIQKNRLSARRLSRKTSSDTDNKEKETEEPEYKSHMEKDIFEQSHSIKQSMLGRVDFKNQLVNLRGIDSFIGDIFRSRRIILIGAASSYHVALACRQLMEELLDMPIFVELASDLLDREVPIFRDDVCIFVSQSGETSSVLQACTYCKEQEALIMGITNGENSRLHAETHFGININAGDEVGVTSTKTYTSQFIVLVMFALKLAADKKSKRERICEIISEMEKLSENIETVLKLSDSVKVLAKKYTKCNSLLVMGRGFQQATSLEGSFKFKEIVNIHSEGINSGELKHGPLALIEPDMPVIMLIMRDAIYDKCINAIQQVKARGGKPIVICEEGDEATKRMADISICIPRSSDCLMGILAVIPLQLFALHLANFKDKNIDSPSYLRKVINEED